MIKTTVRTLIMLAVAVWLGGLIFFPFAAQIAFASETSRESAGLMVRTCLITLHELGLASGLVLLAVLLVVHVRHAARRPVYPAMFLVALMLVITAISQFAIIPRMEYYRIAAGGSISLASHDGPNRLRFEALHKASVAMEGAVLVAGLLLVTALAWADQVP